MDRNALVHSAMEQTIMLDHQHRSLCDRQLSHIGMHRSQHRMLMFLSHCGGAVAQRRIAECMNISPAVVTVTLQTLEKAGYVCRRPSDTDRRTVLISLTEAGEEVVARTHKVLREMDDRAFSGFSDEEIVQYTAFASRIRENMFEMKEVTVE